MDEANGLFLKSEGVRRRVQCGDFDQAMLQLLLHRYKPEFRIADAAANNELMAAAKVLSFRDAQTPKYALDYVRGHVRTQQNCDDCTVGKCKSHCVTREELVRATREEPGTNQGTRRSDLAKAMREVHKVPRPMLKGDPPPSTGECEELLMITSGVARFGLVTAVGEVGWRPPSALHRQSLRRVFCQADHTEPGKKKWHYRDGKREAIYCVYYGFEQY